MNGVYNKAEQAKLFITFKALCANKDLVTHKITHYYINQRSFNDNFEVVFGHKNKFLKQRITDWLFGQLVKPRKTPISRSADYTYVEVGLK
jgi:hypothetical protein